MQPTTAFNGANGANNANTIWNPEGAANPVTVNPTVAAKFYRVQVP